MNRPLPVAAAAAALIGAQSVAVAATQIGEYLTLSGFGTLGGVRTNSDEGRFGKDRQPTGADTSASFDVDTNLGVQMTGTARPWLSATLQVLASKRDHKDIEPAVEWAFVTVKPVDGLNLRLGRMAAPVFAISDSRNVGYANTWVRAPNEVYALNVFRNMTGLDATYRTELGPVALSATAFGGRTEFKALGGTDADGKKLRGLNLQVDTEWANLRVGRMTTTVVIPALGELGDRYTFSGVGITVDRNNVVAQAEVVKRRSVNRGTSVDADSWYAMGGYRFGNVLPYAIRSATSPKTPAFPILVSATQQTTAVGVRWDAYASAAIKVQVDRIDAKRSKGISFDTPPTPPRFPGAPPGRAVLTKPVTALSLAVDYTF